MYIIINTRKNVQNIFLRLCDGMVDVPVLGTGVLRRVGSSPTKGKFLKAIILKKIKRIFSILVLFL